MKGTKRFLCYFVNVFVTVFIFSLLSLFITINSYAYSPSEEYEIEYYVQSYEDSTREENTIIGVLLQKENGKALQQESWEMDSSLNNQISESEGCETHFCDGIRERINRFFDDLSQKESFFKCFVLNGTEWAKKQLCDDFRKNFECFDLTIDLFQSEGEEEENHKEECPYVPGKSSLNIWNEDYGTCYRKQRLVSKANISEIVKTAYAETGSGQGLSTAICRLSNIFRWIVRKQTLF